MTKYMLAAVFAAAAQAGVVFQDNFSTPGTTLDLSKWTTETGAASYFGRTQLEPWTTGGGQFVVGVEGAELALNTYNPAGFSFYGTHGKTVNAFQPAANTAIRFTTRLRITSLEPGIVYGIYLYGCAPGLCATQHDEIDIELVTNALQPGGGGPRVQLNRYANEGLGAGHGSMVALPAGFDPLAMHDWTIVWSLTRIDYLVDGVLLASVFDYVPQGPMQANENAWAPDAAWAAAYSAALQPVTSAAENQRFVALLRGVTVEEIAFPAAVCGYQLSGVSTTVAATGDIRKVSVSTGSGCGWQASSSAAWVGIISGAGTGNGAVRFRADANGGGLRTAKLTVGGVDYAITQAAGGCSFNVSGPEVTLPASGGTFPVAVTASNSACQWMAAGAPASLVVVNGGPGNGGGTVSYSLAANSSGSPRLGYVTVGGQYWQVVQKGQPPQVFSDVPPGYLFFDAITLLQQNGISAGCGGGQYCPDAPMTRREMAAFLIRTLMGESFSYPGEPYFTDVGAGDGYFRYIQKLREIGVTNGCTAARYCPDDTVTRGQMAAFVVRARLGVTYAEPFPYQGSPLFDDVAAGHVFFSYVQKLKELGITNGCTALTYCVNDPTTRGQMAVFVTRSLLAP
ncbi:MAG: S-layer homology domain-containing protein [Bryobacterales bacterium]|nr:S-layer homology domain-containing protein [Bryobacterales bacterium]